MQLTVLFFGDLMKARGLDRRFLHDML
jgi:hypothetical protein